MQMHRSIIKLKTKNDQKCIQWKQYSGVRTYNNDEIDN